MRKRSKNDRLADGFYDRDGQPITVDEWMLLLNTPDYAILRCQQVSDRSLLAVWFGISTTSLKDHGHPFAIAVRYHDGSYRYLIGYDDPKNTGALFEAYTDAMNPQHLRKLELPEIL